MSLPLLQKDTPPSSSNADGSPVVSFSKQNGSALPPSSEHHDEEVEERPLRFVLLNKNK